MAAVLVKVHEMFDIVSVWDYYRELFSRRVGVDRCSVRLVQARLCLGADLQEVPSCPRRARIALFADQPLGKEREGRRMVVFCNHTLLG